jgi:hypothetical protein
MTADTKRKKRSVSARKLTLLRSAKTNSEARFGMGGLEKNGHKKPKPVTLPKLKFLERNDESA